MSKFQLTNDYWTDYWLLTTDWLPSNQLTTIQPTDYHPTKDSDGELDDLLDAYASDSESSTTGDKGDKGEN